MAKVTLIGMDAWTDGAIWSSLTVPDGANRAALIHHILLEYGELEVLYNNPDYMRLMIKNWCTIHSWTMQKLWDTLSFDYDPIYNYDRYETETETPNITKTMIGSEDEKDSFIGKSSNEFNGTNTGTVTNESTSTVHSSTSGENNETKNTTDSTSNEHKVSGYDSNSYVPSYLDTGSNTEKTVTNGDSFGSADSEGEGTEKTTNDLETNNTEKGETNNTGTKNTTTNSTEKETGTRTYERRAYGNIGITTSQQMLEQEREVSNFSWYVSVASIFASELLINVY